MSSGSLTAAISSTADDGHHLHHELALATGDINVICIQDRKDQSLQVLKSELMAKLDKEVKSLDDDSWMFDGPRSRIDLISQPDAEMEVQLFKVKIRTTLQIAVIFLISIGSFLCASSYTGYKEKYIAKGYFEKYDSFTEQEFDNFIANEIPLGSGKVLEDKNHVMPTLSGLHRNVTGEGSHRRLSSCIRLELQHELKPKLTAYSCEVIIIERLPSGVFADPFELQHIVQRGVFTDAAVFGDTNLELPSFRSNQAVVEIHMSIASNLLSRYEDDLEVNLEVPLHARYPPLGLGFSRVEFGRPDLFMCCNIEGNVPNKSCLLMPTNHSPDEKASPVTWEIPCGIKKHAGVVSAVTYGFAIVTALLILLTSISYSDSDGSDKLKSS